MNPRIPRTLLTLVFYYLFSVSAVSATDTATNRMLPVKWADPSVELSAEDLAEDAFPDGWGQDAYEVSVISWHQFQDIWSNYDVEWNSANGYAFTEGEALIASLNSVEIPLGALMGKFTLYCTDSSSSGNITLHMTRYWVDMGSGEDADSDILWSASTSGTPGDTQITKNYILRHKTAFDVDNDSDTEDVNYAFVVDVSSDASSRLKVRSLRILWTRQVSPAPPGATFDDVPTNHWAFRHVQALVASGVTAGCGGGNFCPDESLSRAEMAIFLAKALGMQYSYYNQD